MKILVVGGGGREHALCWALWASPLCSELYCAPGNAGIAELATCVPIAAEDSDALVRFAKEKSIDLTVIGPEAPLVAGLADRLEAEGLAAFGPSAKAAALEGSKVFMKELCREHGIPTADFAVFTDLDEARAFVRAKGAPLVVKTDGLAAGKGVTVAGTIDEGLAAVESMLGCRVFGAAGERIVIEDCLDGEEVSVFALVDGVHVLPLASAQDHKRIGEGDTGPNTGGMGAYSPAPVLTEALERRVMDEILTPTVQAMAARGTPFKGVLFAGLMIGREGPKLLEFNVRFGDPECQALLVRLKSDLLPALIAARDGMLHHIDLRWRDETSLCVVMAAKGYPGSYEKGSEIRGLERAGAVPNVTVFHAGTKRDGERILANGGRVLGVTALGKTIREAKETAYKAVDLIDWPQGYWRRDIGWRAVKRG
ncbi:MAG: phosphoribosylamine--glycine ligase [Alphaproteobacteria bacterium]